ncbi:hypothetical protein ACFQVA_25195 [Actinomadura keratinilytica]
MEYDHVLVVEPATLAERGPAGLRQLYVALTRSTQSLTVLHTAALPAALVGSGGAEDTVAPAAGPQGGEAERLPRIGTDVRVEVVGRAPGGRYKVKPLSPALDRPLVLNVRHGSVPPRHGETLDCWVFANETAQTVLTADQRGRSPVSERMAGRYLAALEVLGELVGGDGDVDVDVTEARGRLSELQGMANRILRRDQADWVDVLHLFGDPDRERLGVLRDLAATANRALKEGTFDSGRSRRRWTPPAGQGPWPKHDDSFRSATARRRSRTATTRPLSPRRPRSEGRDADDHRGHHRRHTGRDHEGRLPPRAGSRSRSRPRVQEARGGPPRAEVVTSLGGPPAGRLRGRRRQLRHPARPLPLRGAGRGSLHLRGPAIGRHPSAGDQPHAARAGRRSLPCPLRTTRRGLVRGHDPRGLPCQCHLAQPERLGR